MLTQGKCCLSVVETRVELPGIVSGLMSPACPAGELPNEQPMEVLNSRLRGSDQGMVKGLGDLVSGLV